MGAVHDGTALRAPSTPAGLHRLWLATTNDNVGALAFDQRAGLDLCAFRRHGVQESRAVKPAIPLVGVARLPIDHELELELLLVR